MLLALHSVDYAIVVLLLGVLLAIGSGERNPGWAEGVLTSRDRTMGGVTASPSGLYLTNVDYPAEFDLPGEAVTVRFWT